MSDTILCPSCGKKITITDALSKQLQLDVEKKYQQKIALIQKQSEDKFIELKKKEEHLKKQRREMENEISRETQKRENELKKILWRKAQKAAIEKTNLELKDLKQQIEEQKKKQIEYEKMELKMRKEKREIEQQQRELELKVQRKLDDERKLMSEKIQKQIQEEMRLKMLEKDKLLEDTKKALEEARRKAAQGSQQNQGEVLELDLEDSLKNTFIYDEIEPIGKGVKGADIKQIVKNNMGIISGVILWEVKQTKNWTEKWVNKFKDDLRSVKANIPVLVTTSLPKGVSGFGFYKNIWVSLPEFAIQLAVALRKNLLAVAYEKSISVGKGEKQELLYNYVSSHEFRQRVEALIEVYQEMKIQIDKERMAFERSWKQREMQLQRFFTSTAGMYGEVQGLVGSNMPEIKGLELESGGLKDNKGMKLF